MRSTSFYDAFDFHGGSLRFHGVEQPLVFRANNRGHIEHVAIWQADAHTGNTTCFLVNSLVGDDTGGQPSSVTFGTVELATQDGTPFYKDAVSAPVDGSWRCFHIQKFIWGHNIAGRGEWDNVRFAYNNSGVTIGSGEVVELGSGTVSGAASMTMGNPADTVKDDKAVLVTGVFTPSVSANTRQAINNTWGAVAFGPVLSVKTSATPAHGDRMAQVAAPSREIEVNAAGGFGVVTQLKNSQGLVRVHRS